MLQSSEVLLIPILEIIQTYLTSSMCMEVFSSERVNERQRLWTLKAMVMFWNEVILRAPPSLTQALQECFGGSWLSAHVEATPEAFFQKSAGFHPRFFARIFQEFISPLAADAPANFASDVASLRSRYKEVWIIDGSRLSAIWKRLKILWDVEAVVLPGCLTVTYDLFRGIPRVVEFYRDAAKSEAKRAREFVKKIPTGTLLVGDALHGVPRFLAAALAESVKVLARYNETVNLRLVKRLCRRKYKGGMLTEELVEAGGNQGVPKVTLRHIIWKKGNDVIRLVTTELDRKLLPAKTALLLYRRRWSIERMFYDLKDVLGLNHIYSGNPNGVGQQVYACCIVYAAMRFAQGMVAMSQPDMIPEDISEKKFFVKIAVAHIEYTNALIGFVLTEIANPGIDLKEPDWNNLASTKVPIKDIFREKRNPNRRKKRFSKERKKWKSFKHIPGAEQYWKN